MNTILKSIIIFALLFKSIGCGEDDNGGADASVSVDAAIDSDARWVRCGDCIGTEKTCIQSPTVEHCIGVGCTEPVFDTCEGCIELYTLAECYPVRIAN